MADSWRVKEQQSSLPPQESERHRVPGGSVNTHVDNSVSVDGDNNVVIVGDMMAQGMKLLWEHIMHDAAHDSSARDPPPRCHPNTRVNLIDRRIRGWFQSEELQELLLWVNGYAGVGKSAVVQTLAEYLVDKELHGASVFCSRPNKRNNPYRVFITIAYQLANWIEAYRAFIAEILSHDPDLVKKDLETQFKTFIIEPFAERKVGAGGKQLGILLDGLDELEPRARRCHII